MTTTHAQPDTTATARTALEEDAVGRARLPYFPALDGLRGIAVAAVLAFHGGFAWMEGGYLGVSTFFTLSGFLITALALGEQRVTGHIGLKGFWVRRVRRLMPASLACLALVVVFGVVVADVVQRENLAGDVIAAVLDVANWRFIFEGQSYADLFAAPSPLLHFWSLAIEEQFYLLYPLLLAGLVAVAARGARSLDARTRYWLGLPGSHFRQVLAALIVVLTLASLAVTVFAGFSDDRIYLGTDTRAAELLLGCLLATLLFDGHVTARLARPGPARKAVAGIGLVALAACVALWVRTPQSSGWLYDGGFALYALLSCAIVAAAILPVGPVRAVLAVPPLRHLGRISYGVYLYHWPIFLWLRQETSLSAWPRFLLGVAVTLALAELSFRFLEMPIRRGRPLLSYRPGRLAPVVASVLVAGAVAVSATTPPPEVDFAGAQDELTALAAAGTEEAPPTTIDPVALVAPPPRVAFFGDSTALQTGLGVANNLLRNDTGTTVPGLTPLGCPLLRTDAHKSLTGDVLEWRDVCRWSVEYPPILAGSAPTLVVVQGGVWDIGDQQLPGDETWRAPGDPVYDEFARNELASMVDTLSADGALVIWLTNPPPFKTGDPAEASQRMARYNELVKELPALRPGRVEVIDVAGWIASLPTGEDARLRPDGTHFSNTTTDEVADAWLADAILTGYRDWWSAKKQAELQTGGNPVQVLVTGDALADDLSGGLIRWADRYDTLGVQAVTSPFCGLLRGGERIGFNGPEPVGEDCNTWDERFGLALVGQYPQVVVVGVGLWDLTDRAFPEWGGFKSPGDPTFDDALRAELGRAADTLHGTGAQIVWLTVPPVQAAPAADPTAVNVVNLASDPARSARLNQLIREMAASRDFVEVVDLAAFAADPAGLAAVPGGLGPNARLSVEGADAVANWLSPGLVSLGRSAREAGG